MIILPLIVFFFIVCSINIIFLPEYHALAQTEKEQIDNWIAKGDSLADLKMYQEAIEYDDKVIEIDPTHIDALNNKGIALDDLGRSEEAIEYV